MVLRWVSAPTLRLAFAAFLAPAVGSAAPAPVEAQRVREFGVQLLGVVADRSALIAGPVLAVRPASRVRVSLGGGIGSSERRLAWRAELLGQFLLDPLRRRGVGVYGSSGVAMAGGQAEVGYLVLAVGVEGRPGAAAGWNVEAGIGGGARLAAGYRIRRRHRARAGRE